MIKAIVSDFSRVLLFPKDKTYQGSLNSLHAELSKRQDYKPLDYFEFNRELLDVYAPLKNRYPTYIFTSDSIQDAIEFQKYLKPVFEELISAKRLGVDKKVPEAYRVVARTIGLTPDQILYIDDAEENIRAAQDAGCKTLLYSNFESFRSNFHNLIKDY